MVFLIAMAIFGRAAHLQGISLPVGMTPWGKIGLILYLCIAFALFCLESFVYNRIKQ